jgi:hypothetical protein
MGKRKFLAIAISGAVVGTLGVLGITNASAATLDGSSPWRAFRGLRLSPPSRLPGFGWETAPRHRDHGARVLVMAAGGGAEDLEALAGHKLVRMRAAAAAHPDATGKVLATLAADSSRSVRRIVAARSDTPPDTLRALAGDLDRGAREAVAANTGTPPDALIALLGDGHWAVRWAVVTNPAS